MPNLETSEPKLLSRLKLVAAGSIYQAECPLGYRRQLDDIIKKHPELFPPDIKNGYRIKDCYVSKKLNIKIRRIQIAGRSYTVRPSFVMPYMTAFTDDAEKALFLSKLDVPAWGIARIFGKNGPYWYRMASSLGRFSLVGTTVRDPRKLPLHIAADEKHTKIRGEKCSIPTTVGCGCILGAAVAENAGNVALLRRYDVFRRKVLDLDPSYSPETVNIDGWAATRNAFRHLFPTICILCCFLHIYITMRDGSQKKHSDVFLRAVSALWECFQAPTRRSFSQKVRRLAEAGERDSYPESILKPIKKFKNNISEYSESYNHHVCHRTSNMIDRLMQGMNRHLYNQYLRQNIF
ncbi:MAG: hypothetical protein D3922_00380 [Candidatus Electrothrix sp. AR1]|nr:hypothetical protein [Candidatus Electrothrix sp. AR1]